MNDWEVDNIKYDSGAKAFDAIIQGNEKTPEQHSLGTNAFQEFAKELDSMQDGPEKKIIEESLRIHTNSDNSARVSEEGISLIKKFEGFNPKSFWDYKHYSIGYGTEGKVGEVLSREEADARLRIRLNRVSSFINNNIKVPLTQNQHDSLASFGFNLGEGNLQKLVNDINSGNHELVATRMLSYNKAGGVTLPGLESRRREEVKLYLDSNDKQTMHTEPAEISSSTPVSESSSMYYRAMEGRKAYEDLFNVGSSMIQGIGKELTNSIKNKPTNKMILEPETIDYTGFKEKKNDQ